jgi:LCP family protein required for cell wall assembly
MENRDTGKKTQKKRLTKKQRQRRKIVFTIIAILLMLILLAVAFVASKLGKLDKQSLDHLQINSDLDTSSMKGYKTIVLFGVDNRSNGNFKSGNSDTMILASINNKTGEIKMCSVYRDSYLETRENTYTKANDAYERGGPEQAINMLNKNLDLNITDYVAVDFNALVEVIDLLGGVDIDVTEDEVVYVNGYGEEVTKVTGKTTKQIGPGMQTLDGVQATSYARIRYGGGLDYKRTERQRLVLTKMFEKAKKASLPTLNNIMDKALPDVSTSLGTTELLGMMTQMSKYKLGDNTGFPFDHIGATVPKWGDVVVPVNLAANVTKLHQFLYNEDNYKVSPTVQKISDTIHNKTGK